MQSDISLEAAQELIQKGIKALPVEQVPLSEACNRIIAWELTAPGDLPAQPQSAVDGFALADGTAPVNNRFTVKGYLNLGGLPTQSLKQSEAWGVLTGSVLPPGTEAVVPHENTSVEGDQLTVGEQVKPGNNIKQAGEDFAAGELVLKKDSRLDAGCMALLAAYGIEEVPVYQKPRVALLGLGKNVISSKSSPQPGQTRDSNGPMLAALLKADGAVLAASELVSEIQPGKLAAKILELLQNADLLITTGGTYSDGDNEAGQLMEACGADILYWGVPIQPGSHNGAARLNGKLFLALSGNPAGCSVGYQLFAAPALRAMQGLLPANIRVQARCMGGFPKKSGSRRFVRAHAAFKDGIWEATVLPGQKPSMLRSLIGCNALIDLPPGNPPVEAGSEVEIILLFNTGVF